MAQFGGQVVWITGGGSGIGKAIALEMAREGADVVVSGRRAGKIDEVAAEIEAMGRRGLAVPCDVTDDASVAAAVASIEEAFGKMDVCIANAGFSVAGRFEMLTSDDWRRQFEVNVVGLCTTVREALPLLRKTRGRVVLIGSVASMIPSPGVIAYTASKYAVRGIGQTLSTELHGTGISCTTIHPGFVESEIAQVDNQGVHNPKRPDKRPANLMWPADKAARVCVKAIAARKREFVFTGHGKIGGFIGRHMPGLAHFVMTRDGAKKKTRASLKDPRQDPGGS